MTKKQFTGYLDNVGTEIRVGDIFQWGLKKGWRNPDVSPRDDFLAAPFGVKPGEITEDCNFISIVKFEDNQFILHTLDENDRNLKTLLHTDSVHRNEFGKVIGNVDDNPEILERYNYARI